jgi:hypothetical protein
MPVCSDSASAQRAGCVESATEFGALVETELDQLDLDGRQIANWLGRACHDQKEAYTQLGALLETYQEDGTALDAVLERLVSVFGSVLLKGLSQFVEAPDLVCSASDAFYRLCKVRGLSAVCQLLPVERQITDQVFKAILNILGGPSSMDTLWQVAYVLFGWGEMAARLPFPFDGQLVSSLVSIGRVWVLSGSVANVGASRFISRLVTRSNDPSSTGVFRDQLQWLSSQFETQLANGSAHALQNLSFHLARLLKHAQTEEQIQHVIQFARTRLPSCYSLITGPARVKVLKQLGLRLGNRLPQHDASSKDVYEQLTWVLQILLEAWVSNDTRERWAAASALSQIGRLLPASMRNDLLKQLLLVVRETSTDDEIATQSACVLVAELARAQLLPSDALPELVSWTLNALCTGQERPCLRMGANAARDAACYVLWSFARHLALEAVEEWVPMIAARLLCTALFDREIQCRRAAAAALQECAGRWGNAVPGALHLADRVNFYAVSDLDWTYGELARQLHAIANHHYAAIMTSYLHQYKVFTCADPAVRARAAQLLAWLLLEETAVPEMAMRQLRTGQAPSAASTSASPQMMTREACGTSLAEMQSMLWSYACGTGSTTISRTSAAHHGALCTLSALIRLAPERMVDLPPDLRLWMESPVQVSDKTEAEQIVRARCDLLLAFLQTGNASILFDSRVPAYLVRSLEHHSVFLVAVAREALLLYFRECHKKLDEVASWYSYCLETIRKQTQRGPMLSTMHRARSAVRDPICYAACVMLTVLVAAKDEPTEMDSLLDALDSCAKSKDYPSARALVDGLPLMLRSFSARWTDERKRVNAWTAFLKVCKAALAFHVATDRGDGGCWVREAAIDTLRCLLDSGCLEGWFSDTLVSMLLPSVLLLCFDRIDRVRASAGDVLQRWWRSSTDVRLALPWANSASQNPPAVAFATLAEALAAAETRSDCVTALIDGFIWAAANPGSRRTATNALCALITALSAASSERIRIVAERLNVLWCGSKDEGPLCRRLRWPAMAVYSILPRTFGFVHFFDEHCGATALAVASEYARQSRDGKRLRVVATVAIQLTWYPAYRAKASAVVEMLLQRDYPWLVGHILEQAYSYGLVMLPVGHDVFCELSAASLPATERFRAFARAVDSQDACACIPPVKSPRF